MANSFSTASHYFDGERFATSFYSAIPQRVKLSEIDVFYSKKKKKILIDRYIHVLILSVYKKYSLLSPLTNQQSNFEGAGHEFADKYIIGCGNKLVLLKL